MALWKTWFDHVAQLRGAFARQRTFLWFVLALVACTVRPDLVGVTSFVRACWLKEACYEALLRLFHSSAVDLRLLTQLWVRVAISAVGSRAVRVDGKLVLLCDGLKAPKEGRKMPAVKSLHQESTNNSKPEYIMGHSWQAISLLVAADTSQFSLPLSARIHEGVIFTNRDRRTLLDRMVELMGSLGIEDPVYLLADAYYACRKITRALLRSGSHLISRVRITSVAHEPIAPVPGHKRARGRPRIYGQKILLRTLFDDPAAMVEIESPYSGDRDVRLQARFRDLVWKPVGRLVRFVAVEHPTLGRRILISTDVTRSMSEIIRMYGWRFKIEVGFKHAIHVVGTWAYHFWMARMKRTRRGSGDQYLHRADDDYRARVRRKIQAYELHVQVGLIAQGLLQCLAATAPKQVWSGFRSWLRTLRPGLPPSELVTAAVLREALPEFLVRCARDHFFAKFLVSKLDPNRTPGFLLAA
jgi:hypothetical protein